MPELAQNYHYISEAPWLFLPSLHYDIGASLVLAPHPDDETLGCGGMIALLRKKNIPVTVCFITDGAASHPNSKAFPTRRLADLRKQEALTACETLGVERKSVYFFDQADGKLSNCDPSVYHDILDNLKNLIQQNSVKTVFAPYQKDAHDDHRATWNIARESIKLTKIVPTLVEYPIWLWKNGLTEDYPSLKDYNFFRLDIAEVFNLKEAAIFAHKSQTSNLITDDPEGFKLTEALLEPFLSTTEYYFFPKQERTRSLPGSYFNKLYEDQADPWNFENSTYEQDKYRQTIDALAGPYQLALEVGCSIGVLTQKLARICDRLLGVDISERPIEIARERCKNDKNVQFKVCDIATEFPVNTYDLIILSEVGYYFSRASLTKLFKNCMECIQQGGHFLLVHWTSYVAEYPLSGKEVHGLFEGFNQQTRAFKKIKTSVHEAYELLLWERL